MSVDVESIPVQETHLIKDLISKTKNKTLEIYSQNVLKNEKLQTSLKKINELSEPLITKYSTLINSQIDRTLKKIILHKDDFKLLQKISEAREKFVVLGDKVLTDAEVQVSNYYNNLQEIKVEAPQEEKSQELEVSLKPRIHTLMKKVNAIAKFWLKSVWIQLKNQKFDKETIRNILENVQSRLNLWENITNAKILMELSYEYLNDQIIYPLANNIKFKFTETQKTIIVTIEGLKQKGIKEIMQEASKKVYELKDSSVELMKERSKKVYGLKNTSVEIYKNKVLVHINKENLKALGDNSRKALMQIMENIKNTGMMVEQANEIKKKGVEKSMELYKNTLENLKKKREEVKDKYLLIRKTINERKMEKKTLKQKEMHEDKSTDHKSDSEHD